MEIFFILSGFFLMKKMEGSRYSISPFQYVWHRLKTYYPHCLFSFLVLFVYINVVERGESVFRMVGHLCHQGPELLLLHGTILSDENTWLCNSVTWYLSVLLLVGYGLVALLRRNKSAIITAAPLIILEIYAYMSYHLQTVNNWRTHVLGVLNYGILRGIAGMLLGMLVWSLCVYARRSWGDLLGRRAKLCFGTGAALFLSIPILSFRWFHKASFLYIGLGAIAVFLCAVGEEWITFPAPVERLMAGCQAVTYAVYLNHFLVMRICLRLFGSEYTWRLIPAYLTGLVLYSAATTWAVSRVARWWGKFCGVCVGNKEELSTKIGR